MITSHVISTLPPHSLAKILPNPLCSLLSQIKSVNVAVVNLVYPQNCLKFNGFGYLVPASQKSNILGVIFDSCAFPEQDEEYDGPFTKLTVMINGDLYDKHIHGNSNKFFFNIAKTAIAQDLSIHETPLISRVSFHKECIPQYGLNHMNLVQQIHSILIDPMSPPISMIGSGFFGVGVNDCIYSARLISQELRTHGFGKNSNRKITGLERSQIY